MRDLRSDPDPDPSAYADVKVYVSSQGAAHAFTDWLPWETADESPVRIAPDAAIPAHTVATLLGP